MRLAAHAFFFLVKVSRRLPFLLYTTGKWIFLTGSFTASFDDCIFTKRLCLIGLGSCYLIFLFYKKKKINKFKNVYRDI